MGDSTGFIGVHVGAGKYSTKMTSQYEKLCRTACKKAIQVLNSYGTPLDAVTVATAILEDSELTNAGYGSNLTLTGNVECDASVMNGSDCNFGAVGAVSGIKNPICLAKKICCNQNERMKLGRIPPCVVVGNGAYKMAQKYSDIMTVFPDSLISRNALKMHEKCRKQLQCYSHESAELFDRLDTVGAVAIDKNGGLASACSSGGILLKQSGRIGQAAMFGCGCWALNKFSTDDCGIAVTTTGCGEHIMKTLLAREIGNIVKTSTGVSCLTLTDSINKLFLNSPLLEGVEEKLCGMLVLKQDQNKNEFLWAHTTHSMCIGYMSTADSFAKSHISILPNLDYIGKTVIVEGTSV